MTGIKIYLSSTSFIKNCNENSDKGYILEAHVEYPKELHDSHNDLPFLTERTKTKKCQKVKFKFYNKESMLHILEL